MKREKPEPILDDVVLCVNMGWTWGELMRQPARFVDKLRIYLEAVGDRQSREQERFEEELNRMGRIKQ